MLQETTDGNDSSYLLSREEQSDTLRATVPNEAVLMIDVLDFTLLENTPVDQYPGDLPLYGVIYFLPHEQDLYKAMLVQSVEEAHQVLFITAQDIYKVYETAFRDQEQDDMLYWSYVGDDIILGGFNANLTQMRMEDSFIIDTTKQQFIHIFHDKSRMPTYSWEVFVDSSFRYSPLELVYGEGGSWDPNQYVPQSLRASIGNEEFDIADLNNNPSAQQALEGTKSSLLVHCDQFNYSFVYSDPFDPEAYIRNVGPNNVLEATIINGKEYMFDYIHIQENIASWRQNAQAVLQDPAVYCDTSIAESEEEKTYRIDLETHDVTEVSLPE